jgi:hypothetical protein
LVVVADRVLLLETTFQQTREPMLVSSAGGVWGVTPMTRNDGDTKCRVVCPPLSSHTPDAQSMLVTCNSFPFLFISFSNINLIHYHVLSCQIGDGNIYELNGEGFRRVNSDGKRVTLGESNWPGVRSAASLGRFIFVLHSVLLLHSQLFHRTHFIC